MHSALIPAWPKKIAVADMIIYNGLGYDDWMPNLLSTKGKQDRKILIVSNLLHAKTGDNPHIWYHPNTMRLFAYAVNKQLADIDPIHKSYYATRLDTFLKDQAAFERYVTVLKQKLAGTPVAATEPVFGYMANALGLNMRDNTFQISMMNEVPPSPSALEEIMHDLRQHQVKILFYNGQVTSPTTTNIKNLAKKHHILIIGVTELQPSNMNYHQWMRMQLDSIMTALKQP